MAFFEYSAANQALQINYGKLVDATYNDFPFIASLRKKAKKTSGRTLNHTIVYSPGGIGVAGALSQTTKEYESDAGSVECTLPWKKYFGWKSADALQIDLMESSENAYIDATTQAQESVTKQVLMRASASILSRYPVTGPLFRLHASAAVSSSTITPLYKSDLTKIEVGMYLSFDSVAVSSSSAVVTYVTSVDRNAGTFDVYSASGISNSDYVSAYADQSATLTSSVSGNFMAGVFAWCPIPSAVATRAVMTGDAYVFGCTRTVDYDRLCGWYYYGASETSREEVLIKALSRGSRINGARPTHIVMNDADMAALIIESQGRLVITDNLISARNESGPIANIGFAGVRLATPQGTVSVFADRDMPIGVAFAYKDDVIELNSVNKEFPYIDTRGGGMWKPVDLRTSGGGTLAPTADTDRYQMKAKGQGAFRIHEPAQCGVIVLPTLSSY
jgi:hypothetical protein